MIMFFHNRATTMNMTQVEDQGYRYPQYNTVHLTEYQQFLYKCWTQLKKKLETRYVDG